MCINKGDSNPERESIYPKEPKMLNAYLADATCEDFKKIRSKVKRS
jgi:hypothetical protein